MDDFDIIIDIELAADAYEEYKQWLDNGGLKELMED